ncbi:unnamed protein product, partial [Rotaria sp. Silwood1]
QITGKLEAVGDTVEPFHFILHPKDEQNLTREDQDKGKELYSLLSGGLAKYKYGDIKRNIERTLNKILKNIQFENDKELILSKILSLQGDIRSFKKGLKANLKDFVDLQDQENVPKDKSWWDWNAFAVAMIGLVQVIAVAVLVVFEKTLGKDILLPQQCDNIRTRVVSSLRNSYHLFADGLKKLNSKYVKIAATTLKAIGIINKL